MKPPYLSQASFVTLAKARGIWSDRVAKAVSQAQRSHGAQLRNNGNPYLSEHIFPVAAEVIRFYGSKPIPEHVVISALLHDAIEDDLDFSLHICEREFGKTVANIVNVLTKHPQENQPSSQAEKLKSNRKYLEHVKRGPLEARIIKLADRLNNLASVGSIKDTNLPKYNRYLKETRELFLPFAKDTSEYFYTKINTCLIELEADRRLA